MYRLTQYKLSLVRDSSSLIDGSKRISTAADIVTAASDMRNLDREQLRVYYINIRRGIIGWEVVSQGTMTASLAHPREIFKGACLANAYGIVMVHNHPSGDPSPSDEDTKLTQRIKQAGVIMGVDLLDHVIVAENGCYSFQASGKL